MKKMQEDPKERIRKDVNSLNKAESEHVATYIEGMVAMKNIQKKSK